MDPFKYREIVGLFSARLPDSGDADQLPDRVMLNGHGTLRPNLRGTSVVFTEVGEFAVPRTRQVAFVDGELMVEVVDGESSILQPLFLEVTVDERANQEWSWTLTFDSLTIGEWGEEISHPALSFPVEEGDGPLELSTVATTVTRTANFVTRGVPGPGLEGITAASGDLVFSWDNGRTTTIGVPDAVPGPPGDKGSPGDVRFEGIDPGITVRTDDVLIGDTSVPSSGRVRDLTKHAPRVVSAPAEQWRFAETDESGRISRAVDNAGRTWLNPHPESPGTVDPIVASQIQYINAPDWAWAVADETGKVALGVRADGTVHSPRGEVAEPYDLVLIIGQSNSQGAGRPVLDQTPDPRIWQFPAASKAQTGIIPAIDPMQHQGPITSLTGHGPGIFFAKEYASANPGRRVLLVPSAYSGTGFSEAHTNTWDWTAPDDGHNLAVNAVRQTQNALTAAGPGARLAGILWHQGEGDGSIPDTYAGYLDGLIAWLRDQLGAPDVPFVIGQLGFERKSMGGAAVTIDKAHMNAPARNENVGFARSFPAMHNPGDVTHFSARGQMRLGEGMWVAFQRARYATTGLAPLGPENVTVQANASTTLVTWDDAWGHVTAYTVEWSTNGTDWSTTGVGMFDPMDNKATISQPGPLQIRVAATNADGTSPYVTVTA